MKNFIKNWDLKKHIAAETMFYASMALVGNALLASGEKDDSKGFCPVETCRNMPKKQKIFNCALLSCFAVDLVGGYCLLKGLKKITKV